MGYSLGSVLLIPVKSRKYLMDLRLSFSSTIVRPRLPHLGAFCVLSFGIFSFCSISLPSRTGSRYVPQTQTKKVHTVRMETSTTTVPGIVVYVTVPNKDAVEKDWLKALSKNVLRHVLTEYQIQTDSEELLIIKTRESLLEALTEHVKANHDYEVPEVIALPITGGNLRYLEWIKNSTRD
ncbi:hypothetical protein OROGR_006237 [Orobanche gracilis]